MVLSTHGAVGALMAAAIPNPIVGGVAAFASHFFLDSIPHWAYKMNSIERRTIEGGNDLNFGKPFLKDFVNVAIDGTIGIALPLVLLSISGRSDLMTNAFIGSVAGIFPDFLQFVWHAIKPRFLAPIQRLHRFTHMTHLKISACSITSQAIILVAALFGLYKL
jgi:hypothetical protein